MHSDPIRRKFYVRAPREGEGRTPRHFWEPIKIPYGVSGARRQWATVHKGWFINDIGMEHIQGLSQ